MNTHLMSMVANEFAKVGWEKMTWMLVGAAGLIMLMFILKPRG